MTEKDHPDMDKEKRTNTRLAVGVGVLGIGAFGAFYVVFFLMMIFRPGMILSLVPIPAISTSALSDGNRAWLLLEKPDMSTLSTREKREPVMKYLLAPIEGAALGKAVEIPAYADAINTDNGLLFLSEGGYRTYDGAQLIEKKNAGIGKDPRGAMTPMGLFVLSRFDQGTSLNLVSESTFTAIPLPQEFVQAQNKEYCPCAQLVWHQGEVYFFWTADGTMSLTTWDGCTWALPPSKTQFKGGYKVISDGQKLHFIHREGKGREKRLWYSIFEGGAWNGPALLPVEAGFMDWDAFLQQGKLKLFIQQLTTQTLYTIEKGSLVDPIQFKGPFDPASMIAQMALIAVGINLAFILAMFGVSAVINRFKRRTWTQDAASYEFASLFRRFIAQLLDSVLLLLPPAAAAAVFFPFKDFPQNPFAVMLVLFSMVIYFFIGGFLYHSLLEGLLGQTLGKKLCGITVLKADFTECTLSAGFLRNLMRLVDAFFYYLAAAVAMAATLKWQRIGDIVAETVVVRKK
jgi:uncharacterized RDD family membrane protein YckC